MIPHTINATGTISILLDGAMKPIDTAHPNYEKIKTAIQQSNWDVVPDLVDIAQTIQNNLDEQKITDIKIENGIVYYLDQVIHNTLTTRMVEMSSEGFNISHLVKFLRNLMENPSNRSVRELYGFLEAGGIPITENGTFLAYKKITNDWKDIYTGKMDNSIGAVVSMPRNQVDEDSNRTCSAGLHVCSYEYLSQFGSATQNRVVICEINPKDVVSIPADYNNTKMRVCEYKVNGELKDYNENDILRDRTVFTEEDTDNELVKQDNLGGRHDEAKEFGKEIQSLLNTYAGFKERVNDFIMHNVSMLEDEIDSLDRKLDRNDFKGLGKLISKLLIQDEITFSSVEDLIHDGEDTIQTEKEELAEIAKKFGKRITSLLESNDLRRRDVLDYLIASGVKLEDLEKLQQMIENYDFATTPKRIGKAITKLIKDGVISDDKIDSINLILDTL